MNSKRIEEIAAAVLYEGYLLYPYRASAIKNRQRWNFGVLFPRAFAENSGNDAWSMQTECLLRAGDDAQFSVRVRFLHLLPEPANRRAAQGAKEREIALDTFRISALANATRRQRIEFPAEPDHQALSATIEAKAEPVQSGVYRLRVTVYNSTSSEASVRDQALLEAMVSTHTILGIEGGQFISVLDPPDELREATDCCRNLGTWPVLAGEEGSCDAMLSSPIILYDYPQIAPESPGPLFDGGEIDEILTLRIMTLTEDEKIEMAQADERTREILERTEALPPEHLLKLHGVLRGLSASAGGPQESK